ncbi:hypothetical protein H4R34_004156 [Dimargaris verticillata]|uniref:Uncharacterized protein n=1 Tax=Dimargaris verticillata TaxID=2761393 RepID=A0A9W8B4R2_9FUNG|nr:hypothetical protein H4R34_004156 [Dimargaris verticillata]
MVALLRTAALVLILCATQTLAFPAAVVADTAALVRRAPVAARRVSSNMPRREVVWDDRRA